MILRGLLGESLGNFVCVRGFAKLGDIEKVSFSDQSFQRPTNRRHVADIAAFLSQHQSLFFPEVILSCQLQRTVRGKIKPLPVGLIRNGLFQSRAFNYRFDGITVRAKVGGRYRSAGDVRAEEHIHIVEIDVDEDYWRQQSAAPFFRIDGNHRLTASRENGSFYDYVTPFCVLLFDDYNENNRHSKIIFHNINSKAKALTSEENLRLILEDDGSLFSDDLLKSTLFGWEFYFTRHLLPRLNLNAGNFSHLGHLAALHDEPRSTLLKLFRFVLDRGLLKQEEAELDRLYEALRQVDGFYEREPALRGNRCQGLLIAFVYYQLYASVRLAGAFRRWIASGLLYDINEVEANSLVNIFDKIMESRSRTIFVSMQFSDDVRSHYDMIAEAVAEINAEFKLDIKLQQLRIDEYSAGHSYQISDEILRLIENSGLLIADLTHPNTNVYHEVGFLMGVNQGKQLKQENFILLMRNRRDVDNDKRVGFNLRGWQQVRFDETHELKARLKDSILKYYQLASGV
jgi:hypothetical protein